MFNDDVIAVRRLCDAVQLPDDESAADLHLKGHIRANHPQARVTPARHVSTHQRAVERPLQHLPRRVVLSAMPCTKRAVYVLARRQRFRDDRGFDALGIPVVMLARTASKTR